MLLCFYSSSRFLRMLNLHLHCCGLSNHISNIPISWWGFGFIKLKQLIPSKTINQIRLNGFILKEIKHFTVNHTYELSPQGLPQNLLSLLIVSNQPNSQVVIRSCIPIPPVIIKQISHDWILMAITSFFYPTPKFFHPIWIPIFYPIPIFNPYFSHS